MDVKKNTTVGLFLLSLAGCYVINAGASEISPVRGNAWTLNEQGAVRQSACHLEMPSASQSVEFNNREILKMLQVTEQGNPVAFDIHLRDCGAIYSRPYASMSLVAPADESRPSLIKVTGASGLALRVNDINGSEIPVGKQNAALNDRALFFTVTPVRNRASLDYGNWRALMDFRLNYE